MVVDEEGQFGAVRSGLSSIYMIRMGLRLVQMLGITRSRLTTSCNECPVPIFSSICFLRIWFRWIQMRGAPTSTDDRRKFPLLRFPNAIVFPSIYLFRIWLQIGSDARNNAKQADDVVQDLGTSRKPAAFDNADGPIWTVGEKGFLHHPKKFQEVARPTKAFFRASLKWNCGTYPNYDATCLYCHLINLFKSNEGTSCRKSARFVRRVK